MFTADLLGTVAAIVNKPLPAQAGEDSYNMLDAFVKPNNNKPIRKAIIHHSLNGFFAIRKGNWKLTTQLGSGGFSIPKEVKPQPGEAPGTLYDISKDPKETNNLYNARPEIVKELPALLEQYRRQGYSRPMK